MESPVHVQVAAVVGFLPDILMSVEHHPLMESWREKGTTMYCYQAIIYSYPHPSKTNEFLFPLNQRRNEVITFWLAVVIIVAVFVFMLSVYLYIITVIVKLNRRKKQQNPRFR